MQHLLDAGFSTRRGIMNAHQELPYKFSKWNLPVSEKARDNSMLLPIFNSLSISQLKYISRMLHKIKK
jgi:dTDP-4-amino-4,6-dideoxygalactose transaminase